MTVSDSSGDITLIFASVPDSVTVGDISGNVTVVLPKGATAYNVTAGTTAGSTRIGVPTSPSSRHVITVTDQSGDIRIIE